MAKFYITGIWQETSEKNSTISHVLLHKPKGEKDLTPGHKVSKDIVATLISNGHEVVTSHWSYEKAAWISGPVVQVLKQEKQIRLSAPGDARIKDALKHLINYTTLIQAF